MFAGSRRPCQERARCLRKRAALLFDEAIGQGSAPTPRETSADSAARHQPPIAKGAWPNEDRAIAHCIIADVFRRASRAPRGDVRRERQMRRRGVV
jgi:hypothetical protein